MNPYGCKHSTCGWYWRMRFTTVLSSILDKIIQSIYLSTLYSTRLSGVTAESVLNSKIDKAVPQHQRAIGRAGVYGGKAASKRCVLRRFLKISVGVAQWTDSRRLFQREGAQKWRTLVPVLVFTYGLTEWLLCLISMIWMIKSDVASLECKCATEPGFAGDIDTIEIWLIDWLMEWTYTGCCSRSVMQLKKILKSTLNFTNEE